MMNDPRVLSNVLQVKAATTSLFVDNRLAHNCRIQVFISVPRNQQQPVMSDHHLHFAAENGYLHIVKDLVEQDSSLIDARGEHGGTPLMFAAFGGQIEIVRYLLAKQACVNFRAEGGYSALYWACHRGHAAIVTLLLKAGAKFQALSNGRTPLMDAVAEGHVNVVKLLLAHLSINDVESVDDEGRSALCLARSLGRSEAEELLVDAGATLPPSPLTPPTTPGTFYMARQGLGKKVLSSSSLSGGDIQKVLSSTSLQDLAEVEKKDDHVLHVAAEHGHFEVVKKWIELDPPLVNKRGKHGGTPIMFASFGGHSDIVSYLLDNGAKIDYKEEGGYSALFWACHRGHVDVVKLLIRRGANPQARLADGRTPLMDAVAEGHFEVVRALLAQKDLVDPAAVDDAGRSAIFFARSMGRKEAEELLLSVAGEDDEAKAEPADAH